MQSQFHFALQVTREDPALLKQVVRWEVAVISLGRDRWQMHEISERLRPIGGGRPRSAEVLGTELIEVGLEGGRLHRGSVSPGWAVTL